MEKEFVSYEIAIALKELGFDEPCLNRFYTKPQSKMFGVDEKSRHYPIKNTSKKLYTMGEHFVLNDSNVILAPTFSQAFRWFREKCNLVIEPCVPFQRLYSTEDDHFEILEFGYRIYSFDQYRGGLRDKIEWDGYDNSNEEEAELECLKKLIEIVKEKK